MKVCVFGLWHLGSVTAACLASRGLEVIGLDDDASVVSNLQGGQPPLFEPGLAELVQQGIAAGRLSFTNDPARALAQADVLWITYDTPVDEDDVADEAFVVERIARLFSQLRDGAVLLISSQLRAGTTRELRERWQREQPGRSLGFAYSPENLRLGKALSVFLDPDRIVVGVDDARTRERLRAMFGDLAARVEWMGIEAAEVTKHALNAFLALSIAFANEVAGICERVGADAKEVERGLKSERRIGPGAYLGPGPAFAGGTLARDVQYLRALAVEHDQPSALLHAIKESNDQHRHWVQRRLRRRWPELRGRGIAVLGLTYKPGTDTLRRSAAVELCRWLVEQGAEVSAHDPKVQRSAASETLPQVRLCDSAAEAIARAEGVVIATPWPDYARLGPADLAPRVVFDPHGVLAKTLRDSTIEYCAVGRPEGRK